MREYICRPEEKPFPFHVWLAQIWIGLRDYLAADVRKKICSEDQIAYKICSQ
jgi:hypothetical protein